MTERLVSSRFPYISLRIQIGDQEDDFEALIDTGFDGAVTLPAELIYGDAPLPDRSPLRLADGTVDSFPVYVGYVDLGLVEPFPVLIYAFGDEVLVGQQVIIEP